MPRRGGGSEPAAALSSVRCARRPQPPPFVRSRLVSQSVSRDCRIRQISLAHYLCEGAARGYAPNPFFDPPWYLEQHPQVAETGEIPLAHYLREGAAKGYAPSLFFDGDWYLAQYPDAATSGLNPLLHYLRFGIGEGRLRYPFDDTDRFRALRIRPYVASGRIQSAIHLLNQWERSLSPGAAIPRAQCFPLSTVRGAVRTQGWELLHEEQGEPVGYAEPAFVGEPERRSAAPVSAPDRYVAVLNDITIIGGTRYIISNEGRLLHDEEAANASNEGLLVKYPRAWHAPNRSMVLQFNPTSPARIPTGIHLMLENDENYFHFIVEILPRLAYLNALGVDASVPLIITSGLHANMKSALEILNQERRPIIEIESGAAYKVDRLIYPSDVACVLNASERQERRDECTISTKWMRKVRDQIVAVVRQGATSAGRRLYVRRASTYRALTNESLIEEMLSGHGFEIVSPGELSFSAQVKLFAEAEHVVMPTGAAVTNIAWCRPGTRVLIFIADHPFIQPMLWQHLGESAGVDIRYMRGPRTYSNPNLPDVHDDFAIDLDKLRDYISGSSHADVRSSV